MLEAVLAVGEPTLTPMAAVAGAVADTVADWLQANGAHRAVVNNGGDVAIRLTPGWEVEIGLISNLASRKVDQLLTITAESGIGGVATSGLGGRSFTRGLAQGVSVLAGSGVLADALATQLANASYLDSERVVTTLAGRLDPQSDIRDLTVVVAVDCLSEVEVDQALAQVQSEAERQRALGNLLALSACVQGRFYRLNLPDLRASNRSRWPLKI